MQWAYAGEAAAPKNSATAVPRRIENHRNLRMTAPRLLVTLAYWICCCALGLPVCGVWAVGYSLFSSEPCQRDVNSALTLWSCQDGRSPGRYAYTETTGFRYRQWLVRKLYLFRIRRRPSDGRAKPECPVMANPGSGTPSYPTSAVCYRCGHSTLVARLIGVGHV